MKQWYSKFLMLVIMIAAFSLIACSGSDDDNGNSSGNNVNIVGTWELSAYYSGKGWVSGDIYYLQFKTNGTCQFHFIDLSNKNNKLDLFGSWSVYDNMLYINFSFLSYQFEQESKSEKTDSKEIYRIEELSKSTLILSPDDELGKDMKYKFKRVSDDKIQ